MTTSPGGYLAFLDLTCCGFGCALLLLLLVAAFNPEPVRSSPRNAATVVHCYRDVRNAGPGPKPEIRIECRRPGRQDWERIDQIAAANPAAPEAFEFTAPAETGGGSESFVIFYAPRDGLWAFRAHLVGFPKNQPVGPVPLKFEVLGEGVHQNEPQQQSPVWPGEYTKAVEVVVSRDQ